MANFADLGIAFPLFEAPIQRAANFVGHDVCAHCGREDDYFIKGIDVICGGGCPACGVDNQQRYPQRNDRGDWDCRSCGANIPFESLRKREQSSLICFRCIKDLEVQFPKDTEFGMLAEENVTSGITGGFPGLETVQFEVVVLEENYDGETNWNGVRVPVKHLRELFLTPTFYGWQQERWLFCCREPMVYQGLWPDLKQRLQPKDPVALFAQIASTTGDDLSRGNWVRSVRDLEANDPILHIFCCRQCEQYRAYFDFS